jgi:hypothetical protein
LREQGRAGGSRAGDSGFHLGALYSDDLVVVVLELAFEVVEFLGELDVGGEEFTKFDEGTDDEQARVHGALTAQDISSHDGTVFRESVGKFWREFKALEVVTICDHLALLGGGEATFGVQGGVQLAAGGGRFKLFWQI